MGKVEYNSITFDSPDELEMYWWCQEALEYGVIEGFDYQGPTVQLAEPVIETIERFGAKGQKIKPKTKVVMQGATYTCDFTIQGGSSVLPGQYIDVKPKFTRRDSDAAKFSVIRKWVYQKHGIIVHPLVPFDLFKKTFSPARARITPKQKKPRAGYCELPTVKEYIHGL